VSLRIQKTRTLAPLLLTRFHWPAGLEIKGLTKTLSQRNRLLFNLGLFHFILTLICLLLMLIDHRQLLGINIWVKPAKFAMSIGIFAWTAGWLLGDLSVARPIGVRKASFLIALSLGFEMFAIFIQAARGVGSHFNISTPFNGIVFQLMAVFILMNTGVMIWVLRSFYREKLPLGIGYVTGIRYGLWIFLLGSLVGGAMSGLNGHTVGAPDGGPGLPFLNWASNGGDLRIAHFLGMHALQILPIVGLFLDRYSKRAAKPTQLVACILGVLVLFLFVQALMGRPLF
jgi:hypothetical protein